MPSVQISDLIQMDGATLKTPTTAGIKVRDQLKSEHIPSAQRKSFGTGLGAKPSSKAEGQIYMSEFHASALHRTVDPCNDGSLWFSPPTLEKRNPNDYRQ